MFWPIANAIVGGFSWQWCRQRLATSPDLVIEQDRPKWFSQLVGLKSLHHAHHLSKEHYPPMSTQRVTRDIRRHLWNCWPGAKGSLLARSCHIEDATCQAVTTTTTSRFLLKQRWLVWRIWMRSMIVANKRSFGQLNDLLPSISSHVKYNCTKSPNCPCGLDHTRNISAVSHDEVDAKRWSINHYCDHSECESMPGCYKAFAWSQLALDPSNEYLSFMN